MTGEEIKCHFILGLKTAFEEKDVKCEKRYLELSVLWIHVEEGVVGYPVAVVVYVNGSRYT